MANILLTRVDFRLIHGQVITTWRKIFVVDKIVIINDELAAEEALINIYKASAPAGMTCRVYNEEKAVQLWEKNQFGDGNVMIIFRDIPSAYRMVKKGIKIPFLLIGNMPKAEGRKDLGQALSLSREDYQMLKELHEGGLDVHAQILPGMPKVEWDAIAKALEGY